MDNKRPHDIADLRRQRERIRRITIGALVVALAAILGSCEGLVVRRDAGAPLQTGAAPSSVRAAASEQRRLVLRRTGWQSDRPRKP
jgi:hypothetical protein